MVRIIRRERTLFCINIKCKFTPGRCVRESLAANALKVKNEYFITDLVNIPHTLILSAC